MFEKHMICRELMGDLNPVIIEEIEKSDYDERIKKFLIELLKLEADHSEEERWNVCEEYEKLVKRFIDAVR